MGKIDNDKMWASLISILENTIDIPKMQSIGHYLRIALKDQGLTYRNGKIYTREELNKYALEDPLLGPFDHVDKDFPVNTNLELSYTEVTKESDQFTEFERSLKNVLEETLECGDTHNLKADAGLLLSIARRKIASEIDIYSLQDKFANSSHGIVPIDLYNYWEKLDETYL